MAATVQSVEYHSEAFTRRRTFYVRTECQLSPKFNRRLGKMFIEHLEPLLKCQKYPIILIHGDYYTGQVRIPTTSKRGRSMLLKQSSDLAYQAGWSAWLGSLPSTRWISGLPG
jgi:hypothetical protein